MEENLPFQNRWINKRLVLSNSYLHQKMKILLKFLTPEVLNWLSRFGCHRKRVIVIAG